MKIFRQLFVILLLMILVVGNLSGQTHHDWSYNLTTYEVNVRQYTNAGTFAEFETHLDRLKELGVGILWFMPIHPIGVQNRLGTLGSYYSVKDYYGVNPEFGTLENFKALVDSIHAKGMYVLIDWVGNHTSWDNPLTISNPEWYVRDNNGNFTPPPGTNWTDVIQLDYSKQGLRDYMIDVMKFWINEVGVDGFRCDAVSFMPLSFWTTAISELKIVKPDLLMLAEDDGVEYHTAGFDMSYGWGLYGFGNGVLTNIVAGTMNANNVSSYSTQENTNYPSPAYRMYFTSNHDENSWYGTVYELFDDAAEVFAVLTSTFRSMPLIYSGQEAGLNHRLQFFDKDEIIWQPHPMAQMYNALFQLKKYNKALWNGSSGGILQRVLTSNNPSVFAFTREKENHKVFVVLNLSNQERTITFEGSSFIGNYRDALTNDTVAFAMNAGITLPAWGFKVYESGSGITGVEDESATPEEFMLLQNYPNPFNPATSIQFSIPKESYVTLKIYDLLGSEVAVIVDEELNAGEYTKTFNAASAVGGLPSGIYFYSLNAGEYSETKKLMLLK